MGPTEVKRPPVVGTAGGPGTSNRGEARGRSTASVRRRSSPLGWAIAGLLSERLTPQAVYRLVGPEVARRLRAGVRVFSHLGRSSSPGRKGARSRLAPEPLRAESARAHRRLLACYLMLAERARAGRVWGSATWAGNGRTGEGGGLAGRLGCCTKTVGRILSALRAVGLAAYHQPPPGTPIVTGPKAKHAYLVVRLEVAGELGRRVALWWQRRTQRRRAPESAQKAPPAAPVPSSSTPPPPRGAPPGFDAQAFLERFGIRA